jgi:hypothetical protein
MARLASWTGDGAVPISTLEPEITVGSAFVALREGRHFHRAGCQLVEGKEVVEATPEGHNASHRLPCGVCQP